MTSLGPAEERSHRYGGGLTPGSSKRKEIALTGEEPARATLEKVTCQEWHMSLPLRPLQGQGPTSSNGRSSMPSRVGLSSPCALSRKSRCSPPLTPVVRRR